MSVNLDRLFGSLNLANTIVNGDFFGFELVYYTNMPVKIFLRSNIDPVSLADTIFKTMG